MDEFEERVRLAISGARADYGLGYASEAQIFAAVRAAIEPLEERVKALEAWREEIDPEAEACQHWCHDSRNSHSFNYCPACGGEL